MKPTNEKVLASSIKPFWTPKGKVVAEQCSTCPFGPNAHKLNDAAEAIAVAKASASVGLDFHCHCTVYTDVLKYGKRPKTRPMSQWRVCAGAVAYKQTLEVETRKDILRSQGRLIEDE